MAIQYKPLKCRECGSTANVNVQALDFKCTQCHFYNVIAHIPPMRLFQPLHEQPKSGPTAREIAMFVLSEKE